MDNDVLDTKSLPLGRVDFSSIRKKEKIYVDKTQVIYTIAKQDVPVFLARPRRFGKSLLVNTLHSLFEKGVDDFRGLSIEKIWDDTTYKVVHFDFSGIADDDPQEFKRDLVEIIVRQFNVEQAVSSFDTLGIRNPSVVLAEIAQNLDDNSVVLLVDEYDAPLTHHIDRHDELQEIMRILNNFYATIKQFTDKFRFIFITGVTRASHVSIFSAFNNIKDLSLRKEFNTILGFTQDELGQYFDLFIENAARILRMTRNDVYAKVQQYYDGYQFAFDAEQRLYNPWSILNFLDSPQDGFKNYWFQSGGVSSIISQYLKISNSFDFIDYDSRTIFIDEDELSGIYEIDQIPRHVLLFQAGYLTIGYDDGIASLVLPNSEVEDSLFRLYLTANNLSPRSDLTQKMKKLSRDIDNRNISGIINLFNSILNECVSTQSKIFDDERSIRDIIYAALIRISSLQKIKERQTAKGMSDLELVTDKTCMVIEFKRTYPNRGPELSLKKAVEQVKNNQYGLLFSQSHEVYRVGMVISSEKKMILHDFCQEIIE
ncbi:MAG: AAA family ATPase [Desulfovibrio sp.]|nr:AAA family ATPase [Desulfovibrio sp.]